MSSFGAAEYQEGTAEDLDETPLDVLRAMMHSIKWMEALEKQEIASLTDDDKKVKHKFDLISHKDIYDEMLALCLTPTSEISENPGILSIPQSPDGKEVTCEDEVRGGG